MQPVATRRASDLAAVFASMVQRWDNCEIAEHGLSWKQLFFERNLAEELEGFGVYTGITRKHEDEMLRPPIDSTHPRWASLYPKLPVNAPDGLPMKERFCKYGVDCKAIAIASSPTGIWPSLDRCKSVVPGNLQLYVETYAHAHLDPEAVAAAKEAAAAAAGATGGAAGSLAASQRQPFGAGGVGQQPKPGAPPAKPAAAGEVEPEVDPDADCDGNVLREYVGPSVISEFQSTGMWPAQRQPCLLCKRAEELEKLTRKIKVCVAACIATAQCLVPRPCAYAPRGCWHHRLRRITCFRWGCSSC